jgi:hypothetical protein
VDVRRWLQSVGEPALAASFGGNMTGSNLLGVTEQDLEAYSVEPAAHRVAVLEKIVILAGAGQDV